MPTVMLSSSVPCPDRSGDYIEGTVGNVRNSLAPIPMAVGDLGDPLHTSELAAKQI